MITVPGLRPGFYLRVFTQFSMSSKHQTKEWDGTFTRACNIGLDILDSMPDDKLATCKDDIQSAKSLVCGSLALMVDTIHRTLDRLDITYEQYERLQKYRNGMEQCAGDLIEAFDLKSPIEDDTRSDSSSDCPF